MSDISSTTGVEAEIPSFKSSAKVTSGIRRQIPIL
jgi:hypothetical protein